MGLLLLSMTIQQSQITIHSTIRHYHSFEKLSVRQLILLVLSHSVCVCVFIWLQYAGGSFVPYAINAAAPSYAIKATPTYAISGAGVGWGGGDAAPSLAPCRTCLKVFWWEVLCGAELLSQTWWRSGGLVGGGDGGQAKVWGFYYCTVALKHIVTVFIIFEIHNNVVMTANRTNKSAYLNSYSESQDH